MDNVIQNINLEDIIPSEVQTNINPNELNELINSIKKFGIIEPLLVRPVNGKYEIVLGNKIYQAALKAGINLLPAIVKNIDDDIIKEYRIISNISQDDEISNNIENSKTNKAPTVNNLDSKQNNIPNNSDIINLSELNKQEYEREDVKMNNELNNNIMNNNLGIDPNMNANVTGEPTFGGKFFPSLEDEPTNMNMGGITQTVPTTPVMPEPITPIEPKSLIDLTDGGVEKQPEMPAAQDFTAPEPKPIIETPLPQSPIEPEVSAPADNQSYIPNQGPIMSENIGNTISLDNLTSQYAEAAPQAPFINQTMTSVPDMTNQVPTQEEVPQFDMSQSIDPNPIMSPDINLGVNSYTVDPIQDSNQSNPNIDMPMPNYNESTPNIEIPAAQDFTAPEPMATVETPVDMNIPPVKDATPIVNTIKTLASNLEAFGYTISVNDEELATSTKITIEIQK